MQSADIQLNFYVTDHTASPNYPQMIHIAIYSHNLLEYDMSARF